MAMQMTLDDRKRIDFLLQLGWTPVRIAKDMGRSKSTIIREIVNRSVECDRGYRCSNRICALFDSCTRVKGYGGAPNRLFRCTAGCYEVCRDFVERTCERLDVPSRVLPRMPHQARQRSSAALIVAVRGWTNPSTARY